jgi:hypothetical protein
MPSSNVGFYTRTNRHRCREIIARKADNSIAAKCFDILDSLREEFGPASILSEWMFDTRQSGS